MAKTAQRTPVPGPAFIRLLARLAESNLSSGGPALSDRLSEWVDWTRAVTLSKALDGRLPPAVEGPDFDADEDAECQRIRAALEATIVQEPEGAKHPRQGLAGDRADGTVEYTVFRERYLALQRAMLRDTSRLRGRLRDMLTRISPGMARLAEVDALMEQTLSAREHSLLAKVPVLLGVHFERLREAGSDDAWLEVFRRDMQSLLLAELDVRFQPIEGLLAALRTH
ncbi:DUF3348 domain-containing protein [Stenotrophomonas sp. TWI587]|uniref:DUF3348 domain-containing protein n=1 Tax=Stenotrophomonas sp. TWI587 TaxID=3136783 RepID=UPI00320A2D50